MRLCAGGTMCSSRKCGSQMSSPTAAAAVAALLEPPQHAVVLARDNAAASKWLLLRLLVAAATVCTMHPASAALPCPSASWRLTATVAPLYLFSVCIHLRPNFPSSPQLYISTCRSTVPLTCLLLV